MTSEQGPGLIDGIGLWCMPFGELGVWKGRAAAFLDRDGVIVEETGYLGRSEDVRLLPGVADAIVCLNRRRIPVVVITNQAGIGHGRYGWDGFRSVQARIRRDLADVGAQIDMELACAYSEAGKPPFLVANHPWRKPNPGMLLHAAGLAGLDLAGSIIVGDKVSDLEAGFRAGLGAGALVLTGHGSRERHAMERVTASGFATHLVADLPDALRKLLPS